MWRSQCIEEDDRYIMYVHTDQPSCFTIRRAFALEINWSFSAYILTQKAIETCQKLFSSLAGQVERSPSIIAPDIWITLSLSHQISHYIQMTIPAARDMKEGRRMQDT